MGLMLALPSTSEPSRGQTPEVNRPAGDPGAQPGVPGMPGPDPFRAPLQEPDEVLPNSEIYKTAQLQIAKGNPTRALELFERYLKAHPELQAHQLQLVYSNMAYCLNSLGRRQDAQAYGAKIDNLRNITALPDDLWESAHRAENDGRGIDMRRYYARFLLQQDQLGKRWASQGKIAEAYMKIGDSYRIDAEKGSQVEALRANINRNLKKPDGAPRPKPPTGEVDNKQKGKQAAGKQAAGKQGGGH
jgi:tetratricopeptide (TPR) repeat protein